MACGAPMTSGGTMCSGGPVDMRWTNELHGFRWPRRQALLACVFTLHAQRWPPTKTRRSKSCRTRKGPSPTSTTDATMWRRRMYGARHDSETRRGAKNGRRGRWTSNGGVITRRRRQERLDPCSLGAGRHVAGRDSGDAEQQYTRHEASHGRSHLGVLVPRGVTRKGKAPPPPPQTTAARDTTTGRARHWPGGTAALVSST